MRDTIREWLTGRGLGEGPATFVLHTILVLIVVAVALVAWLVTNRVLLRIVRNVIRKTRTDWDDALFDQGVFRHLARLVPGLVVHLLTPLALGPWPGAVRAVQNAALIYMLIVGYLAVDALLNGVLDIYRRFDVSRRFQLKSFIQVLKIIFLFIVLVLVVSLIVGRSPIVLFGGLGALTAVLLLIFKDSILGFVAGIQLTMNNMVDRGDWIAMPDYGADGNVLDVSLTTVKVQNWDKTITTIPTYALISDSFKNWRGMEESGGRRIKRSIAIDMTTVKICDEEMVERFRKFAFISQYIDRKQKELADWNAQQGVDDTERINGRRMTNLGTFRAYVEAYLRSHPMVNEDMTFLVRHLPPTERGLPIEIYVFCRDKRWANYEAIQADIFDHIIAVVPEFDLKVFQYPTGADVGRMVEGVNRS